MMPRTRDETKKKSKMGSIGCASPIEEEQLCETKLAMDHFGSFP